jgi:hypothetical protein
MAAIDDATKDKIVLVVTVIGIAICVFAYFTNGLFR